MKRIGQSDIIGQRGIAHIEGVVLSMGFMFYPTGGVEAGIDGFIELRDEATGAVGNVLLQVQGKATERQRLQRETEDSFEFSCSEVDINYWMHGTAPVLFIVVLPERGVAYWKSIKAWFSDPDRLKSRKIVFDKQADLFARQAKSALAAVALSTIPGATSPSVRIHEDLIINLVGISFARTIYWAPTSHSNDKSFGAALRELDPKAGAEWIVRGKAVLSFHNLDAWPWNKLCEAAAMEEFGSEEWSDSDDEDRQRDFVALLNRAMSEFVRPALWHDRDSGAYFFPRPKNRNALKYAYRSLKSFVPRDVVKRYGKRREDPSQPAYWRHSAFLHRFLRLGAHWRVEITPTYHFTRDGYNPDLWSGDRLKKIKEFENNAAVMGQFIMWRYFLANHHAADLYAQGYPLSRLHAARAVKTRCRCPGRSLEIAGSKPGRTAVRLGTGRRSMKLTHLSEPFLEFGGAMRHVDIRFDLMDYGPFDFGMAGAPKRIKVGIVGSTATVEGTALWIETCRTGFEAKPSRQPNLFPAFPGLSFEKTFRCEFITSDELQRVLPTREIARLAAVPGQREMTKAVVESIADEIGVLAEQTVKPDVVLVALPIEIIERTYNARDVALPDDDEDKGDEAGPDLDFRGMLKASCMTLRLPIQLLWPTTFDPAYKIPRKLKESSDRRTQDPATIAWNLLTALYYKAGGLPWRLARDARQLRTSFVGMSFYRSVDGEHVHTSTAQMFDERGEGLILRGGRMIESEEDRKPHLTAEDAYELLRNSLKVFRAQHGHYPARVVLHKTSRFDGNEMAGFHKAIDERDIDYVDFIWVQKSMTRLYRLGVYPPLRGSLLRFGKDQALLYTRGSVEFFRTYPGMYVPRPLMLRCQALGQPMQHVAAEALGLTKMNWNNTQFDNGLPITIAAARQVGEVLKYVPDGQDIAPRYSFYM